MVISWTVQIGTTYMLVCTLLSSAGTTWSFLSTSIFVRASHLEHEFNPLNAELNPICYLLALLGAYHVLHVSRIRVKSLPLKQLKLYVYGVPILDVSRSHTTTQHSR